MGRREEVRQPFGKTRLGRIPDDDLRRLVPGVPGGIAVHYGMFSLRIQAIGLYWLFFLYNRIECIDLADNERIPVPGQVLDDGCHGGEGAHGYTRLCRVVPPGSPGF